MHRNCELLQLPIKIPNKGRHTLFGNVVFMCVPAGAGGDTRENARRMYMPRNRGVLLFPHAPAARGLVRG